MATTYDISITDTKLVVKTTIDGGVNIDTYSREDYKALYKDNLIIVLNGSTGGQAFYWDDISEIASITDYREGGTTTISIPASLLLLYTDVIESVDTPFFFEVTKIDSSSPVDVAIAGATTTTSDGLSVLNTEENLYGSQGTIMQSILWELQEIKKVLNKIYS